HVLRIPYPTANRNPLRKPADVHPVPVSPGLWRRHSCLRLAVAILGVPSFMLFTKDGNFDFRFSDPDRNTLSAQLSPQFYGMVQSVIPSAVEGSYILQIGTTLSH